MHDFWGFAKLYPFGTGFVIVLCVWAIMGGLGEIAEAIGKWRKL